MIAKVVFILGLAAFCTAVPKSGSMSSIGAVLDKFEKEGYKFPAFVTPTAEEWIGIIRKTLHGSPVLANLQLKNYSIEANETGQYADTTGANSLFNSTTYFSGFPLDKQFSTTIFKMRYETVGDDLIASDSQSETLYTSVSEKYPLAAAAGVTFTARYVVKNDSYEPISYSYKFFQGEITDVNNTFYFESIGLELFNSSNNYSVLESVVQGELAVANSIGTLQGNFGGNSIPLTPSVGEQIFPLKNSILVAHKLRDTKVSSSDIVVTQALFEGEITLGEEGTYKFNTSSSSRPIPDGAFINATASADGKYKSVNQTAFGNPCQLYHTLSEVFSASFF